MPDRSPLDIYMDDIESASGEHSTRGDRIRWDASVSSEDLRDYDQDMKDRLRNRKLPACEYAIGDYVRVIGEFGSMHSFIRGTKIRIISKSNRTLVGRDEKTGSQYSVYPNEIEPLFITKELLENKIELLKKKMSYNKEILDFMKKSNIEKIDPNSYKIWKLLKSTDDKDDEELYEEIMDIINASS